MLEHVFASKGVSLFGAIAVRPAASPRHVRSILHGSQLQAKLKVGATNDKYEREADRVADQVMRMSDADLAGRSAGSFQGKPQITPVPTCAAQRLCAGCEEELQTKPDDRAVQRQPEEDDDDKWIQPKAQPDGKGFAGRRVEAAIASLKDGGKALPAGERAFFESRFGRSFENVRVHTDSDADKATGLINARAFTVNNDIAFNSDAYRPGTRQGRHLMAHELTHVVQQQERGPVVQGSPRYEDCDRDGGITERGQIYRAHYAAIALLRDTERALMEISPGLEYSERTRAPRVRSAVPMSPQLRVLLRTSFEIRDVLADRDKLRLVRSKLRRAAAGLAREDFNYECDYASDWNLGVCGPSVYAWTGPAWDIHICVDFMGQSARSQAIRIAHEALHKWSDTEHGTPDSSARNPGSYDYLFEHLRTGRWDR